MIDNKPVYMALDVSTKTIGIAILIDDGSEYGNIIELTHINPKIPSKVKGIEQLFLKKKMFEEFISKFKDFNIDKVIIEEPLMKSNNISTCSVLLRFNGMISDCVYNILGVVPEYISSYDARKYAFPELMAIRKYGKDGKQYDYKKIMSEISNNKFVLFGSYSWEVDKKTVIQDKVSKIFPEIQWVYDKKGELKKENHDASDAYVAALGYINKQKYGEPEFKTTNITSSISTDGNETNSAKIEYDVEYWNRKEHRITYVD